METWAFVKSHLQLLEVGLRLRQVWSTLRLCGTGMPLMEQLLAAADLV